MRPRLFWLLDVGSDLSSRAGDFVSRPFTRLEAYCNRRWWEETMRRSLAEERRR